MRNKKVIYILITILLIIILGIIGLFFRHESNTDITGYEVVASTLDIESEPKEQETPEQIQNVVAQSSVDMEDKDVEPEADEISENGCHTQREYHYMGTEYASGNAVNMYYPEIAGLEDEAYQRKVNSFIQKWAMEHTFKGLISDYKDWYETYEFFGGISKEQNELGEVRVYDVINDDEFGGFFYLYGDILSMSWDYSKRTDGVFSKYGVWERGRGWHGIRIYNIDMETGEELELSDVFVLDNVFFETIENADVTLYNDQWWEIDAYDNFVKDMKDVEGEREDFIDESFSDAYLWYLNDKGNLCIIDDSQESWWIFELPLTLFKENLQPKYKEYAEGNIIGYDASIPPNDTDEMNDSIVDHSATGSNREISFEQVNYQYSKDVTLEFFQVTGMPDIVEQGKLNDYIFGVVVDAAINDLSYAYMNNKYYEENEKDKASMIFVESIIPDYYTNVQILSFTHTLKTTRKAYTTTDGVKKDELVKGPYFQAYNYDMDKGKELTFGDLFEADDELFDTIHHWFYRESEYYGCDRQLTDEDEIIMDYQKSVGINFVDDMGYDTEFRDGFINGEKKYYHWFIDQSEEGSNLCIYRYNTIDCEEKCLKIPMSILKDKIKPEYEGAF